MTRQQLLDLRDKAEGWSDSDVWPVHGFAYEVIELLDELLAVDGETARPSSFRRRWLG